MSSKIETLERQIEQKKARLLKEQARLKKQRRKDETRRKILVGSYMLEQAKKSENIRETLAQRMDYFLTRDSDRKLFGLPPKS